MTLPSPADIAKNPELFHSTFLKVLDKKKTLVPLRWNAAQRHFNANRTGHDLILKARQLGFTTYVQGEIYRRAVTRTINAITLTHNGDATTKLRLMADRFHDHCKFGGIAPGRKYANAALTTYTDYDSTTAIATAGSLDTGRGDTYSDFHGSEVAFWPDAEKIVTGAMQGGNPDVVLESTPNGAQGYFYNLCMEALHGAGIWKLHFYAWWWDAEYQTALIEGEIFVPTDEESALMVKNSFVLSPEQLKWRRNKIKELKQFFSQEYPEDPVTCFLTSGFGYFGDLSEVWTAPLNPEYDPTHSYSAGLDFGQTVDFTAMPVLDFTAKCQVDLLHINNMPWAEHRRRIKQTYTKWHLPMILAEKNSIGDPNIEALRAMGIHVNEFETTHESKASIMSSWNEALHNGGWKLQDIPVVRAEHSSFVATQLPSGIWRLEADGEGHDDIVMGCGLGYRSGQYTVSDKELQDYGNDNLGDIDDDLIAYRADTMGISFENAKKQIEEERNKRQ